MVPGQVNTSKSNQFRVDMSNGSSAFEVNDQRSMGSEAFDIGERSIGSINFQIGTMN